MKENVKFYLVNCKVLFLLDMRVLILAVLVPVLSGPWVDQVLAHTPVGYQQLAAMC